MSFKESRIFGKGLLRFSVVCIALLMIGMILTFSFFRSELQVRSIQSEKLKQLQIAEGSISEDTIILQDVSVSEARKLADQLGARLRTTPQGDFSVLYLPEGTTIAQVYENDAYLDYLPSMGLDYRVSTSAVNATGQELLAGRPDYEVTDPLYNRQGNLDCLNLGSTWETTRGAGVSIAIIDTGIDTDHPEFVGRISEASYNASTDQSVRDFGLEVIEDEIGHGTAVAGVVGAAMNNAEGITGIAPEAELIIIKCDCDENGDFLRTSDLVFGLAYAIECDADVINMSFGTLKDYFKKYTQLAVDSDIICVASAGNCGNSFPLFPASDPNVIGVGAFNPDTWLLETYSNYGDNSDLVAPGTVFTTKSDGGYETVEGTSVAAPIVTGAVALYLSQNSYQEFKDVFALLQASSNDLGTPGEDWINGFGALDIHALVCEPKGVITFEMMSSDVSNQTQVFVQGHTVQTMPEPIRSDVVLDGWFYDEQHTDECSYFTETFSQDITLYAKWINEDDGTAFTYAVLDDGTAEIQSYTGKRRYLTIPNQIEGYTVSSIGFRAFAGNARIRSIVLPETLTRIGEAAFSNCSNLLSIEIPEHVRYIGDEAFSECVSLNTVGIVPNGELLEIGRFAFSNCSITSFTVPVKLNKWGNGVLAGSDGVNSITVTQGSQSFQILDGALCDITGEMLYYYPAALSDVYVIPDSIREIMNLAFCGSNISEAIFPEGLLNIEGCAFMYSSVQSASLPSSVTTIGAGVWTYCPSLHYVDFSLAVNLHAISEECFRGCSRLFSIDIPDWFTTIEDSSFCDSGLKEIHFGAESQMAEIGPSAFQYCDLTRFTLPFGVEEIQMETFYGCEWMTEFEFAEGSKLSSIDYSAFMKCYSLSEIDFPETLETIRSQAFYESGLDEVHLGGNISTVEPGAFSMCTDLQNIFVSEENTMLMADDGVLFNADQTTLLCYPAGQEGTYVLPDRVRTIEAYGFSGAWKLTRITMNDGLEGIGAFAFEYCSALQTPVLSRSLVSIGEHAFYKCESMSEPLTIPASVISIGRLAFYGDFALTSIEITERSALSRIGYATFGYCGITEFDVPASVTSMGQSVFEGCKNLTRVTFQAGSSLENLPAWVFRGVNSLQEIVFEEGSALRHIEARALEQIPTLTSINLGICTQLEKIGNFAFQGCSDLAEVELPDSVVEIGRFAFSGCKQLSEINIPESVDFIGRYAFSGTNGMKVYFDASLLPLNVQEYWDFGIIGYYLGAKQVVVSGDWKYVLSQDGEVSLVGYTGSATELDIDTIDGYPVVSIGSAAFMNNSTLTRIKLPDDLKAIYKNAFSGTVSLQSVTIPSSVTVIDEYAFRNSGISGVVFEDGSQLSVLGQYAFADTKNLTSFYLPEGVEQIRRYTFFGSGIRDFRFAENAFLTEIGFGAFNGSAVTSIELPDGLEKIDHYAFSGCSALNSVTFGTGSTLKMFDYAFSQTGIHVMEIPANVSYIGEFCFSGCTELEKIAVSTDNPYYASEDGVLYSEDRTKLICCPAGKTGDFVIADHVTKLAFGAFEGSRLSTITISNSSPLSTLGYRAFFRCENLEKITIPDGVRSIGSYAFAYCSSLKTVNIGEESQLGGIYNRAFYQCSSLESIYIPAGVQEIDDYAFSYCSALVQLNTEDEGELKFVGDRAFEYTALSEWTMPSKLLEIGEYAFFASGMDYLGVNDCILKIGEWAFGECGLSAVSVLNLPENMTYLGERAFDGMKNLQELTLPYLGTSPNNPFVLTDLLGSPIQSSLTALHIMHGDIAANACSNLMWLKTVTIGDDCTMIGERAFAGTGITEFFIPGNVWFIGGGAFNNCNSLNELGVSEDNPYFELIDGVLYNESLTELIFAERAVSGDLLLPETVIVISDYAFNRCKNLSNVTFPEGLTMIGEYAFSNCVQLERIILPDSLTSLGYNAFADCSEVKEIVIGSGLRLIPHSAFYGSAQTECVLTIREGLQRIDTWAFLDCTGIKRVELPDSLIEIEAAFWGCKGLEEVILGNSMSVIGENAFYGCTSLKSITLPASDLVIEANAFTGSGLEQIYIPQKTVLETGALTGCNSLQKITVDPEHKLYAAVDGCLYDAQKTKLLVVPKSISGSIFLADGITVIDTGAFSGCSKLVGITIPDSVTVIGDRCFYGCSKLENITLSENLITLSKEMFSNCSRLKEIVVPGSVEEIGANCFAWCSALEKVTLQEGLTKLGSECFEQCKSLTSMELPDTLEEIGSYCFDMCTALEHISVGSGLKNVGRNAFSTTAFYSNKGNWDNGCLYLHNVLVEGTAKDQILKVKEGTRVIAEEACTYMRARLIFLPDSVEYIGRAALSVNGSLVAFRMSENIKEIGYIAFNDCLNIRSVYLPESTQNAESFLGNTSYDEFHQLKTVWVESTDCLDTFALFGHMQLQSLIVPYEKNRSIGLMIRAGSSYGAEIKKLAVTGNDISMSFLNGIPTDTVIYCQVPEGYFTYSLSNQIYYEGEWNQANFWSHGVLVQASPYAIGEVLDVPAESVMQDFSIGNEVFLGWDINGDGVADQLPSTVSAELNAHAVWHHVHTPTMIPGIEPTCTEDGLTEGSYCSDCGEVLIAQKIIFANGHSYESVVTEPTCTQQGFTTHTCTVCGYSYISDSVAPLGHSYKSVVIESTCTEQGFTTHTCNACGDSYVDTYVDALGHDMGEWIVVIEATCSYDGQELQECARCEYYETRIIEAPGHSYSTSVTKPTCTEHGYTRYVCSVCGDIYISDYVIPTGHDHEAVVTDPTCTEQGYTTYTCHCGDRYVSDYTAALGHDIGDWVTTTEATCTETGEQIRECTRCDYNETRDIDTLGHDWDDGSVTVQPTEETEGEMTYTCQRCSVTRTEAIPKLEHEHRYEAVITVPTCTERGFTTHTCRCGNSYVDSYVDALDHDMGEWFNVTEATCTSDGMRQRDCFRCDHHETQVIEAAGHDYESVVTEPTCTDQGYTIHTCHCSDSYTDSYTAALGHSFTAYISDSNATCTHDGTKTAACDRCDATDTVTNEGSAHGHDFTDWAMIRKPTETVEGLESRYCLRCGVEETRTVACLVNPFTDIPTDSFYYEPVMWAVENEITNGTSATTFGPNDQCMRAHVVTFLWRAVGSPEPSSTNNPFVDVKETDFYYKPVLWALEKGITSGMDVTHFGPTSYCNRAQVVTFLYRTMGSPELESAENPFTDVAKGSFYEKPVLWAVENGITNGLSATAFGPNSICNRAQIVTFLYRAFVD